MCSVILFFRVLCNFVFRVFWSFSLHVRHFYFPIMKKRLKNYLSKMFPQGKFIAVYFNGYMKRTKESPMKVTEANR